MTQGYLVPGWWRSNSGGISLAYIDYLIQTKGASEVWSLGDLSGTTAIASVNTARNGTYTGVALNDTDGPINGETERAGRWDGTNDYCNINTASFRGIFNGAEGSAFGWAKAVNAGFWTDGANHEFLRVQVDVSNFIIGRKESTNNTLAYYHMAGGTQKAVGSTYSDTIWFSWGLSWSKSADQMKAYLNGAQTGATQTGLGTWAGTPTTNLIGAATTGPIAPMNGWLMYTAVKFGAVWSATDFSDMHNEAA